MNKKQFYGIKYPFTNNDVSNYYLDINQNYNDKIRSNLMHVIFTPKGQRLRQPDFGTNLIKYIFEPSDDKEWGNIISEISNSVNKYISNIKINDISVLDDDDKKDIYVKISYSVENNFDNYEDNLIVKL